MVRTLEDFLRYLDLHRIVTEVPSAETVSLVEIVTGQRPTDLRHHAKGNLVFRLARKIRASPEVLSVRLIEGKITFVHPALWPELYRIAMEPARRRGALQGLGADAQELLSQVERDRQLILHRGDARTKAKESLEARLLVHTAELHTEEHPTSTVLTSWRHWASDALKHHAESMSFTAAMEAVRDATRAGASSSLGPWVY